MLDIVKLKFECEYPLAAVPFPSNDRSGAGHFRPCAFGTELFRYRQNAADSGLLYGILRGNLLKSESGKARETGFYEGVYDDE